MSAQLELSGRRAVVTGASRGIGLATARALVARGARVALLARGGKRLEQAAADLGEAATAIRADVSDPDSVRAAFTQVRAKLGGLDILVNNAGMAGLHTVEAASDKELRAQIDTNLLGVVYCARAAIPMLREAGGGDIVNVSSSAVADPYPYLSIYAATKAAVEMFSVALRREVAADGTRVTVFRSGPAWTAFNESWDAETAAKAYQAWEEGGYPGWGGSMDPDVVGGAIAQIVALPKQASTEFFELHPTIHAPSEPQVRK